MCRKVKKKDLILKAVTIIDAIMGWFEIMQYYNKRVLTIANLVETTWLTKNPWPT